MKSESGFSLAMASQPFVLTFSGLFDKFVVEKTTFYVENLYLYLVGLSSLMLKGGKFISIREGSAEFETRGRSAYHTDITDQITQTFQMI